MLTGRAVPAEVRARYVDIIDDILAQSDLTQVTEKRIRNGIQERVQYDITPQKVSGPSHRVRGVGVVGVRERLTAAQAAIKGLIMERFDIFNARQNGQAEPVPSIETADAEPATNGHGKSTSPSTEAGHKREADDGDLSDVVDNAPPPKKKKRKESVADDAAFAAKLQAEEDRAARPTRGGATRKAAPAKKKKATKKKTTSKVTASDDSDVEDGRGSGRKVNRDTGFHKPMNLSATAADFFGTLQVWAAGSMNAVARLANLRSCRVPRSPRRFGTTSRPISCRTPATSSTSCATTSSRSS